MAVPRSTVANSSSAQTGDELAVMSVLKRRAGFHSVARLASPSGLVAELGQDNDTDFFLLT